MLEDLKIPARYDGFAYLADTLTLPRLRPHKHVELELNLVERGTITYVIDGKRYRFGRRTLLWLFPSQEHQLIDGSNDARYYVAVFKPTMVAAACRSDSTAPLRHDEPPAGPSGGQVLQSAMDAMSYDVIRNALDALMEGGPDPDLLSREAGFGAASDFRYEHDEPDWLNAGLRYLLMRCWRSQVGRTTRRPSVTLHGAVRKVMAILSDERSEHEDQSIAALAAACGVSSEHLSRTFARQVGVPLSRYRNALRLRRFWDHYRSAAVPSVTHAAFAAGFGSYAQFYKVFVAAYGTGPRVLTEKAGHPER